MVCKECIQKLGDVLKDTFITGTNKMSAVRKVSRLCPLVLLKTVGWRQGRAFSTGGNKSGIWKSVLKRSFYKLGSEF